MTVSERSALSIPGTLPPDVSRLSSRLGALPQLVVPGLAVLVLFYLTGLPILFLVYGAFVTDIGGSFTLGNLARVFGDTSLLPLVGRTLVFAFGASFVSLLLGGGAAWVAERTSARFKTLTATANLVSLTTPSLLLAIAWISLLAPKSGYLNGWLATLFQTARGPFDIYSLAGMIWVEAIQGAPFTYLLMVPVLRGMDRSFEEAASVSGAGAARILRRITVPILIPAILSTLIFRFVRGLESFEVPALIGVPGRIDVAVSKIYSLVAAERAYGAANAYAVGLMLTAAVGIYLYSRATRATYKYATITGKTSAHAPASLGRGQILADAFLLLYVLVIAGLPLLTIAWNSLIPFPMSPSGKAFEQIGWRNFEAVFTASKTVGVFRNTFVVAGASALVCVLLSAVVGWIVLRTKVRGRWMLDLLTFLPVTIPGVVLGVALVWIYLSVPLPIYGTLWILIIASCTSFLPIGMRFIAPAIAQIHNELEEAAHMAGAGWPTVFRKVILPLIFPAVLGAGLYIFMLVFRVLASAIVIYTPGTMILPVLVYETWGEGKGNTVYALLVVNTVVLLPFAAMYYWLSRRYGFAARG